MCEDMYLLVLDIQKEQERLAHSSIFYGNTQIITEFVGSRQL